MSVSVHHVIWWLVCVIQWLCCLRCTKHSSQSHPLCIVEATAWCAVEGHSPAASCSILKATCVAGKLRVQMSG